VCVDSGLGLGLTLTLTQGEHEDNSSTPSTRPWLRLARSPGCRIVRIMHEFGPDWFGSFELIEEEDTCIHTFNLRSVLSAGGWFFVWSFVVLFLSCRVLCCCGVVLVVCWVDLVVCLCVTCFSSHLQLRPGFV